MVAVVFRRISRRLDVVVDKLLPPAVAVGIPRRLADERLIVGEAIDDFDVLIDGRRMLTELGQRRNQSATQRGKLLSLTGGGKIGLAQRRDLRFVELRSPA